MVADGYFVSEDFKEIPESLQKEMFDKVQGTPVKVVGLTLYSGNTKRCDVLTGETMLLSVPIGFVEPVTIINKPEDDNEPTSEEIKPVKAVEEKTEIVSFPFTDYSRMEGALLFFARNGYKVWVEDTCHGPMFLKEGKLNVEKTKGGKI